MPVLWGQVCVEMTFSSSLVVIAARFIVVTFVVLVAVFTATLTTILVLLIILLVLHILYSL